MNIRPMLLATPLAGLAALAVLAGCQSWGPTWSEVSGARYNVTDFNRFATAVNLVDSQNPGPRHGYGGYSYYKLDPGKHTIELSALNGTPNWVSGINRENMVIDIEPCKRYYLNAEFDNRLLTPWKPMVDYVEPIPGCGSSSGYK
jgi:hypothetical protein